MRYTQTETENGAASILIELEEGEIVIKHGTDGDILRRPILVKEGTWHKLFLTIEGIIDQNKATL